MQQNLLPHRNYLTRRRAQTLRQEGNMLNLSELRNLLEPMPPNDQIGIQQNAERRENSQSRLENIGDRTARGEHQNRGSDRQQPNFTERMDYDESIVDDGAVSLVGEADEN
ncbi:hypothetical protein niasHS_017391 [Heterodera schachtii]|uniref:Uncharacterized protein n=2 Tax=Heterodera TaxID=34509 RepID=A0ABD2HTX4_HETSC